MLLRVHYLRDKLSPISGCILISLQWVFKCFGKWRVCTERHAEGSGRQIWTSSLLLLLQPSEPLRPTVKMQIRKVRDTPPSFAHYFLRTNKNKNLKWYDSKSVSVKNQHLAAEAAATTQLLGRKRGLHFGELVMFITKRCARLEQIAAVRFGGAWREFAGLWREISQRGGGGKVKDNFIFPWVPLLRSGARSSNRLNTFARKRLHSLNLHNSRSDPVT